MILVTEAFIIGVVRLEDTLTYPLLVIREAVYFRNVSDVNTDSMNTDSKDADSMKIPGFQYPGVRVLACFGMAFVFLVFAELWDDLHAMHALSPFCLLAAAMGGVQFCVSYLASRK
jgi:hypothetical protein